jgi:hypothetical protein
VTGMKKVDTISDIGLSDLESFKGVGPSGVEGMRKAMTTSVRPGIGCPT